MKRIFIPASNPEDWKPFLADPKHWRKGYSAMSLAYCWQEANGFPASFQKAFKQSDIGLFKGVELLIAIPEYKVPLPGGSRPSQNDIFVLAKGNNQLISITVEGKVSEDFNKLVSDWLVNASTRKRRRLNFLCSRLGLAEDDVHNTRYQLLHRTASAVIEAEKFNIQNAAMLVHSFSQSNEWFNDYANFVALFGIKAKINTIHNAGIINGISLFFGWIKGEEKYLSMGPDE